MNVENLSPSASESESSTLDEYTQKRLQEEEAAIQLEHVKSLKKMEKLTAIYGGVGALFFIVILAVYAVPQFLELQKVRAQIEQKKAAIEQNIATKESKELELKKVEARKIIVEKKFGSIIPKVLPEVHSEQQFQKKINSFATFFEDLALSYHSESNILEIPSVDFGKPEERDDIFVVPIRMAIEAGRGNFSRFLNEIDEKSGSIDLEDFYKSSYTKQEEPIPVMSIDALTLSYPEETKTITTLLSAQSARSQKQTYSFSVSISAYFKATKEMKELYGSNKKKKK